MRAALIYLIWIARRHQQWLDKVCTSNTVMTDAVSSTHSPPVLVSATERSCTTLTALALYSLLTIISCTFMHVQCIIVVATIQGWQIVWLLFEGSDYSKKYVISSSG